MSRYESPQTEQLADYAIVALSVAGAGAVYVAIGEARDAWRNRGGGGASRPNGVDNRDQQTPNPTPPNSPTTRRP